MSSYIPELMEICRNSIRRKVSCNSFFYLEREREMQQLFLDSENGVKEK